MGNVVNAFDFNDSLAVFLASAVSDGTYDDILTTLKFDEVGNEALATQIDGAGGQLWSNVADDYILATYQTFYRATKTWRVADNAARDLLGSDDNLVVDDIGYTEDTNTLFFCVSVDGASASTWSAIAPAAETWAQTLTAGAASGATSPSIDTGQKLLSQTGGGADIGLVGTRFGTFFGQALDVSGDVAIGGTATIADSQIQLRLTSSAADATNKITRFVSNHFTNAEPPVGVIQAVSVGTTSTLNWGGGTSLVNAATQHSFYTATNNTTTTGTERLRIDGAGAVTAFSDFVGVGFIRGTDTTLGTNLALRGGTSSTVGNDGADVNIDGGDTAASGAGNGGAVNISGRTPLSGTGTGGPVNIAGGGGGTGAGNADGAGVFVTGGDADTSGTGGAVSSIAGQTLGSEVVGATALLQGGENLTTTGTGGITTVRGGDGQRTGGGVVIKGGTKELTGAGFTSGTVLIESGDIGGTSNYDVGDITIQCVQPATPSADNVLGGNVFITASATGIRNADGGSVTITAGDTFGSNARIGGDINFICGDENNGTAASEGGSVNMTPGSSVSGSPGVVNINGGWVNNVVVTPAAMTTTEDDFAPGGTFPACNALRLAGAGGGTTLSGIVATAVHDGQRMLLVNVSANNIILANDTTSTAANRFLMNAAYTVLPDQIVELWYDGTSSRWRVMQS